ncbi:hypothetical protein LEMLEM_LOCUS22042 [Lemmus lemmus]
MKNVTVSGRHWKALLCPQGLLLNLELTD